MTMWFPKLMQEERRWNARRNGEKKPVSIVTGLPDEWQTLKHTSGYSEVMEFCEENLGEYEGLAFVVNPGIAHEGEWIWIALDFDNAKGTDGKPLPWIQEIVDRVGSYTEWSRSGNGLHIFFRVRSAPIHGMGLKKHDQGSSIEVIANGQLAVTGNVYGERCEIADHEATILASLPFFSTREKAKQGPSEGRGEFEQVNFDLALEFIRAYLPDSIPFEGGDDAFFNIACVPPKYNIFDNHAMDLLRIVNEEKTGGEPWDEERLDYKRKEGEARVAADGELGKYATYSNLEAFSIIEDDPTEEIPAKLVVKTKFPIHVFPPRVREFVIEGANAIGCDIALIAPYVFCSAAQCVRNSRYVQIKKSWSEPLIFWHTTIADSGSHKSPAWRYGKKPIETIEAGLNEVWADDYADWKRRTQLYKDNKGEHPGDPPIGERVIIRDTTTEARMKLHSENPGGLLWMTDEISQVIRSLNQYKAKGTDKEKMLTAWSGDSDSADRKTGDRPDQTRPFAKYTGLSIVGGTQPGVWRDLMLAEHNNENGLDARFLVELPPEKDVDWSEDDTTDEVFKGMLQVLLNLRDLVVTFEEPKFEDQSFDKIPERSIEETSTPIPLSSDALALWIAQFKKRRKAIKTLSGAHKAAYLKLEAYAARFAGLIHVLWAVENGHDTSEISLQEMTWANELSEYYRIQRDKAVAAFSETAEQHEHMKLVEFIRGEGGTCIPSQLRDHKYEYRYAGKAREALRDLAKAGYGTFPPPPPSGPQGGAPVQTFTLHPSYLEHKNGNPENN